ncbi:uncharacterized protein SPAPADRAFT_137654 [Spathaspora passalidarum NRRL Y-27907]|uniref:Cysteine proteinase 1, mitochondrial n=1 Tax=Spathaspora passalidarum (strain NRRL Y-27907 / 11-Y1) TaxID=619300 RepID=G3AKA0_SPAPN|nr:uncharacterized protein SPAPADRAFT_137654 [Spathaspora passalidarum NRRL Y-27907]EGW33559.1 hypothetical protein SPAPADRAFT_137654 [Spathaspora passalidarum NRRL Y-27907]
MPARLDNLTNYTVNIENVIDNDLLNNFKDDFMQSVKNNLTQNAFSRNSIQDVITRDDINTKLRDQFIFNIDIDMPNSPYNNQGGSERCWVFAGCNVLRNEVIRKYNLTTDFQLSQSYVWFYDQLEKANLFLEKMVILADEPFDEVESDLQKPVDGGGFWDNFAALVLKYGLVPHDVFPDTYQAIDPSTLVNVLTSKLQEFGLKIRQLGQENPDQVDDYKEECLQVIYNILALTLGTPPKPEEEFTWEFANTDGEVTSFNTTALDFYEDHVDYNVTDFFVIMNDPTKEYNKSYVASASGMVNHTAAIGVNVEIKKMKDIAIDMLKDGKAVYFAAKYDFSVSETKGVFDTEIFDFYSAFDFELNLDKKERKLLSIGANHAMVIAGVHIDPNTNEPVRWKVQNSYGTEKGHNGWFLMTDDWFDEAVDQIVSSKDYVSDEIYDIWTSGEYYE